MKLSGAHFSSPIGLLLSAAAFAVTFPCRAHAEQFVLIDLTYEATAQNTTDSHYVATPIATIPKNWRSPVDYASGTAYLQFEVLTKPSAAKTVYNICFENPSNYACLPYPPAYTGTGTQPLFSAVFSSFWQVAMVDWTMGVTKVWLVMKDESGGKVQGNAQFFPTKIHATITIVSPGATYMPPAGTPTAGAGGAAGSGGAGGTAGAGGRGGAGAAGAGGRGGAGGAAGAGGRSGAGGRAGAAGAVDSAGGTGVETGSDSEDPGEAGSSAEAGSMSAAGRPAVGSTPRPVDAGSGEADDDETTTSAFTDDPTLRGMPPSKRTPPPGGLDGSCAAVHPGSLSRDAKGAWLLLGFGGVLLARTRRRRR